MFLFSCKETNVNRYLDSHILIANIDTKNNLLTYSYWKDKDYAIKVEDLKTDKILFSFKIKDNCFTEPRIHKNKICFPESDDSFICMDYKRNIILWRIQTKGRVREFQYVNDDMIIASINSYGIVAINSNSGKVMYELLIHKGQNCSVDDAPRPITYDDNYFYVADFNCNSVVAYDILSGKKVWSVNRNSGAFSNLIVAGKYIFVGSNDSYEKGEIMLIESKTGKIVYSKDSKFEIMMNPILYQNKIYYYTYDSKLNEFNIEKRISKIICNFSQADDISGSQIYQLDNFLYFQDVKFNLNRMNLTTLEKEIIGKCPKGLLGVYKINNVVKFVY
jgi:outer membrane protein assembly factor BamB